MEPALIEYFIRQTNDRLKAIEDKLDDLQTFKVEMLATSRMTALVVSAVLGFVSVVVSGVVTYFVTTHFIKGG